MSVPDTVLRNAKPKSKRYSISIGESIHLEVMTTGSKIWRMRYRRPETNKQAIFTIGKYPDISQPEARQAGWRAKDLLKQGIDPVEHQRQQIEQQQQEAAEERKKVIEKTVNTFEKVARDWHQHRRDVLKKWEPVTAQKVIRSLELHVFDVVGNKPITEVSASDVLGIIEKMQEAGKTNVVRKVGQRIKAVFEYANMRGLVDSNPAASISSEYAPYTVEHNPTLEAGEIKQFFDDLNASASSETLKIAIEFTMRTLARTEEVRYATWSEFDFENALWTPEPKNRKGNKAHTYPLPVQVISLLERLKGRAYGEEIPIHHL